MAAATARGRVASGGPAGGPEGARFVLKGRPGDLLGVVELERAPTRAAGAQAGAGLRLRHAPVLKSSLPTQQRKTPRLRFLGATQGGGKAPVHFAVAAQTPPGRYEVVFDVAGAARTAEIEVLADPRLEIEPGSVDLVGPPGGVVTERLILINAGNVPLELDVLGLLVLEEEEQICLSLQRALARVKAEIKPGVAGEGAHQRFLDTLVESLAERKTEFGRVGLAHGPLKLAAGAVEAADVAFHLPKDMVVPRQYRALMKSGAATLFVTIRAEAGGEGAPRRRSRAAAG